MPAETMQPTTVLINLLFVYTAHHKGESFSPVQQRCSYPVLQERKATFWKEAEVSGPTHWECFRKDVCRESQSAKSWGVGVGGDQKPVGFGDYQRSCWWNQDVMAFPGAIKVLAADNHQLTENTHWKHTHKTKTNTHKNKNKHNEAIFRCNKTHKYLPFSACQSLLGQWKQWVRKWYQMKWE